VRRELEADPRIILGQVGVDTSREKALVTADAISSTPMHEIEPGPRNVLGPAEKGQRSFLPDPHDLQLILGLKPTCALVAQSKALV
jgi:hypothetical protein